jgi:hypothetical protein
VREGVETGIAIIAAVHADVNRAEKILLDGATTMRTSGFRASAIRAEPSGGEGRLGSGAALSIGGEVNSGHSGYSVAEIVHPKCRKARLLVFQKNKE